MSSLKALEEVESKCRDLVREYMSKDFSSLPDTDDYEENGWLIKYYLTHAVGNQYVLQLQCKKDAMGETKVVGYVRINDIQQQISITLDRRDGRNTLLSFTPKQRQRLESRGWVQTGRTYHKIL